MNQVLLTNSLLSSINSIFSSLYSSIDEKIYSLLDGMLFINSTEFLNSSVFKLLGTPSNPGLIMICDALLLGFLIYYALSFCLSHLTFTKVQNPSQFIFKLLLCAIAINFSINICYYLVLFFSYVSICVRYIGESFLSTSISFTNFTEQIWKIFPYTSSDFNIFSFDGLIRSLVSFGFINLAITYSLRYIMIKVFTLISPFAILCLAIDNFSWVFKSWIKIYISLLFLQVFVSFVLLICFSLDIYEQNTFSSFLYLGTIYALIKSNSFIKDFIGGIITDANISTSQISSFLSKK